MWIWRCDGMNLVPSPHRAVVGNEIVQLSRLMIFIRETCISVSEMRSRTIPPQAEGIIPRSSKSEFIPLRGGLKRVPH